MQVLVWLVSKVHYIASLCKLQKCSRFYYLTISSYRCHSLIDLHFLYLLLVPPGYYNTVRPLESIALHLDSVNGKPFIWEELVSCFLRLFSDRTTENEDCFSCNVEGDAEINASSSLSSVFCEQHTRESWKLRCKWWMNHHFSQNNYMSETEEGNCFSPEFSHCYNESHGALLHLTNFVR
jgi:hypothetical protein